MEANIPKFNSDISPILESAKYIVDSSKSVHIRHGVLAEYADSILLQKIDHYLLHAPVKLSEFSKEELLNFIFLYHSLSFSYWGNPDYFFMHEGKTYKTSWGLMVALFVAAKKDRNILDINFLAAASNEYINNVLNKSCVIPMFEDRCDILRDNATVLKEKFGSDVKNIIIEAGHDAGNVLNILYNHFPKFRDEAILMKQKVFFMKKAQILVADIDRAFPAPVGKLKNVEKLTACADYRLPQLMRHLGILQYSSELSNIIDSKTVIQSGDSFEIEIRGATIMATDLIKNILEKKYSKPVKSIDVNDYLWISAKNTENMKPYHLVRTTMY